MILPIQAQKQAPRPGIASAPFTSEVVKRMASFFNTHSDYRCRMTFVTNGKSTLNGWFELHRSLADKSPHRKSLKIAFSVTGGAQSYSYVHNGNISLEIWPTQNVYDRLTTEGFFLPESRQFEGANVFPVELAIGQPMPDFYSKNLKVTSIGHGQTQYFITVQTRMGKADRRIVLGSHGELLVNESRKSGPNPWSGYTCSQFNYKPDPNQKFDTRPPIGLYQYGFDHMISALTTGQPLPNLTLKKGGKSANSWSALDSKATFIVFLDGSVAKGLPEALKQIGSNVKVVVFSLRPLPAESGYPDYLATGPQFDQFGIGATPMFYLIKGKKLDQAWMGFDRKRVDEFVGQVKDALAGKHVPNG